MSTHLKALLAVPMLLTLMPAMVGAQIPGDLIQFELITDNFTRVFMTQEPGGTIVPFYSPRGFHRAEVIATPGPGPYNVYMEGQVFLILPGSGGQPQAFPFGNLAGPVASTTNNPPMSIFSVSPSMPCPDIEGTYQAKTTAWSALSLILLDNYEHKWANPPVVIVCGC